MIAEKKIEEAGKSSAKLTVTVDKDEARKEYDNLVQKYCKTAQIKGFRRGKVPSSILEQKFGDSLRSEASINIIESSLQIALEDVEKKPLQFEPPKLEEEVDLELGKDFTFTVTYDVFPEIALGPYKDVEIEVPQVAVGKEDIERRLEQIRDQNAVVMDKPAGAAEKDDIATINYVEVDADGNEIEGTSREDFVFTLGSGYNRYKFDEDIEGMACNEEKVIEKEFPDDFEDEELAGKSVRVKVRLTQLKQKDLPELDDELAQDVSEEFKTLEDLKNSIKTELQETVDNHLRQRKVTAILEKVSESTTIEIPESMVRAELESSWRSFVMRSGVDEDRMQQILTQQERTTEQLLEEWRPSAERSIKTQLIMGKIREDEGIEVSDEELDKEIEEQAQRSNMDVQEARENIERNNMMDYLRNRALDRKLQDFLLDSAKIKKGKKTKLLDLLQDNQ